MPKTPVKKPAPTTTKAPRKPTPRATKLAAGLGRFPADAVIRVLSKSNPRREGSKAHKRFLLYKTGITVGEWREAGKKAGLRMPLRTIRKDIQRGSIAVEAKAK